MCGTRTTGFALAVVFAVVVLTACKREEPTPPAQPRQPEAQQVVKLRIGYRASLPADVGPLWAHEAGALKRLDIESETKGFGPPAALLQALKGGEVDMVTVMPLEPVLEDIRLNKATYIIYCLQCFSPKDEFDAVVVRKPEGEAKPTWDSLSDQAFGVIPTRQNELIGQAIVKNVGLKMQVRPYNPANPLLGLESKDFGAIHVLGADVARAKADASRFSVLEACTASKRVFGGKEVPAGVGLISREWVSAHPKLASKLIDTVLQYSEKTHTEPNDPQLTAVLGKQKYGAFSPDVAKYLVYAPLISYKDVKSEHFNTLMDFLQKNGVEVPTTEAILRHVYAK